MFEPTVYAWALTAVRRGRRRPVVVHAHVAEVVPEPLLHVRRARRRRAAVRPSGSRHGPGTAPPRPGTRRRRCRRPAAGRADPSAPSTSGRLSAAARPTWSGSSSSSRAALGRRDSCSPSAECLCMVSSRVHIHCGTDSRRWAESGEQSAFPDQAGSADVFIPLCPGCVTSPSKLRGPSARFPGIRAKPAPSGASWAGVRVSRSGRSSGRTRAPAPAGPACGTPARPR